MEYKKDIHQGQTENTENKGVSGNFHPSSSENSIPLSVILKRTEKLVTALYMVTDCMEGNEPIKIELRSIGVSLLRETHASITKTSIEASLRFHEVKKGIAEIKSLLGIGATIGFVSEMNFTILEKEFSELESLIDEIKETPKMFSLPHTFFEGSKSESVLLGETLFSEKENTAPVNSAIYKGHIKDTVHKGQDKLIRPLSKTPTEAEERQQKELQKALSIGLKHERRSTILKIVKDKKEVTIKDISNLYTTCSEKTIQRELIALVAEGVLKKAGEKRWSRYSLATPKV